MGEHKNWFARNKGFVFGFAVAVAILNIVIFVLMPQQTPIRIDETVTEYACGDCRSQRRVQTRHFCRNRPNFRRFFLPLSPPESHALWRRRWRRLSVPRCKAG